MLKRSISMILACLLLSTCIPLSSLAEELDQQEIAEITVAETTIPDTTVPDTTEPAATEQETTEQETTEQTLPAQEELLPSDTAPEETEEELLTQEIVTQTQESNAALSSGSCGAQITWELKSVNDYVTLTISGTGEMSDFTSSTVPWKSSVSVLDEVIIEEGITYIGKSAFYECKNLSVVHLPASLQRIGSNAFSECKNLTTLHIQDIDAWYNITYDTFESAPGNNLHADVNLILKGEPVTNLLIPEGITALNDFAFTGIKSLLSVTFPKSLTSIGERCFSMCESLTYITIPETLTQIGTYAFHNCSGLIYLDVIGGGKHFASNVFYWADNLQIVNTDSIANWCSNTFDNGHANPLNPSAYLCVNGYPMTNIRIPGNVDRINDYCFYEYEQLEQLVIDYGVTAIGESAFGYCENLIRAKIADSVCEIGNNAFNHCTYLSYVNIPTGLTEIPSGAFSYCSKLTSIEFPEGVKFIRTNAFSHSDIDTLYISESIQEIEYSAFGYCEIAVVYWPATPTAVVNESAFYRTATLFCYPHKTAQYESFTQNKLGGNSNWYCLEDAIEGTIGSCKWKFFDRVLTISGKGDIPYASNIPWKIYINLIEKVVIEEGVTRICQHTFKNHTYLTQVDLPSSLKKIDNDAFRNCGLRVVTIPEGVMEIGQSAFEECKYLEKITLPETLTRIGNHVFCKCTSLQSIVFPKSLEDIGYLVFEYCTGLISVRFLGNMPYFSTSENTVSTFDDWTGFVYYPASNATWTKQKVEELEYAYTYQDRGGTILLIPHDGTNAPQLRIELNHLTGYPFLVWDLDENVDRYEVYRSTSKTGTYTLMDTVQQIYWEDESAAFGKTYYYKVRGICDDDASLNTAYSNPQSITCRCGIPQFYAEWELYTGKLTFKWEKVNGAKKYEIYRATSADGKYTKLATTTGTSYTDKKAAVGKEYYYKMRAVAADSKNNSDYTGIIYGYAICAAPKLSITYNTSGKPVLSWSKVSGVEEYVVYRCKVGSEDYEDIEVTSNTTYTDTSAKADVGYYYAVQSLHKNYYVLDSFLSDDVYASATFSKPTLHAPTNVNPKPVISWNAISGAMGYNIYRSTSSGGTYTLIGTTASTQYVDTAATGGKNYYYKVTTLGNFSESLMSASVCIPCPVDIPVITVKAGSTGKPVISWNKVTGAKKYQIWRSSDGINFTDIATTTSTSYTDKNATGGKYTYAVVALASKSKYNSGFSAKESCYVTCAMPTLTVKLDTTGKPSLSWGKITGAVGYEIYRSKNGEAFALLVTTSKTAYLDTDTKPDNQYSYKLVALGKEEVTNSPESAVKTIAVTVGTPKIAGTINDQGKPVITWGAIEDAVKYVIYRSTSSSKNYKEVTTVTELFYEDTSVAAGKTYYYKVMAIGQNSNGAQSAYVKLTGKCGIPELSVATGSTGKPVLSWNKIAGAKKYEIWRSVDGGTFKKLTTTTKITYTDTKATNGTRCAYKVKALGSKSSYNGLFSEERGCCVACATPAVTIKVDTATGKPSLSWKKVTGAIGYNIYRDGNLLITVSTTSYLDIDAQIGTKYIYTVIALGKSEDYWSGLSKAVSATATCGQTKVTGQINAEGKPELSWLEVEGASNYVVYRSTSSSKKFKKIGESSTTSYTDTTAKKGTTYYYRVVAEANGTTGAQSSSTGKLKAKK